MVLRSRTRLQLRRAVVATALGALFVPAVADAKKAKTPVISKVTPKTADVGTKLTIQGKHFRRGKAKNSVLFRRDKGKALFVKADVSTTKKLTVVVPKTLEKYMLQKSGAATPTRFRLRVLASKLSKKYTSPKISPVIGPERSSGDDGNSGGAGVPTSPDGDCDSDGVKNGVDLDDDNDLMADGLELSLVLDPCVGDTDGDGVEDGFEYQSAVDLNNDDYQSPNYALPYPGKTPYPNPLFKDSDVDYDGDSLTVMTEYKLWKYTYEVNHTATRTLSPLSYSDGTQFSLSALENGNGRRLPTMPAGSYLPPQDFRAWTDSTGYSTVLLLPLDGTTTPIYRDLFDMDRDTHVDTDERYYWGGTGFVSDDERDEDVDGLTNFMEDTGMMSAGWWKACYAAEAPFPIAFAGTRPFDADSDGDGVRDGADDQDFDDVPNIMELYRSLAGNVPPQGGCNDPDAPEIDPVSVPAETWVNPFNPCLPDPYSRTCPRHPAMTDAYPPFGPDWKRHVWH
jgi:hypothetical protein